MGLRVLPPPSVGVNAFCIPVKSPRLGVENVAKKTASSSKKTAKKSTVKKSTKKSTAKKVVKKPAAKKAAAKSAAPKAAKKKTVKAAAKKTTTSKKSTRKAKASAAKKADAQTSSDSAAVEQTKPKLALATKGLRSTSSKKKVSRSPFAPPPPTPGILDCDDPTPEQLRKVKTGLSKRDIDGFRKMLMEKRAELLGDVASLEFDSRNESGNLSNMPLHMADVGSDNYEQEFTLGLVESERKLLREIDEALLRVNDGTYGVCLKTAKPIGQARLEAKPWAKYSIEVVREMERLGKKS